MFGPNAATHASSHQSTASSSARARPANTIANTSRNQNNTSEQLAEFAHNRTVRRAAQNRPYGPAAAAAAARAGPYAAVPAIPDAAVVVHDDDDATHAPGADATTDAADAVDSPHQMPLPLPAPVSPGIYPPAGPPPAVPVGPAPAVPVGPVQVLVEGRERTDEDDYLEDWDDPKIMGPGPEALRDIKTPTAAELEEHNTTHIPAAAWCPYCVQGNMANTPHRRVDDRGRDVPLQLPTSVRDRKL